jgi:DNA polymerase III alpha subunit
VEDFTGSFECLVFHKTYAGCGTLLEEEARILISGRASAREGERATVIVDDVRPLADAFRGLDLHLQVSTHETEWSLDDLKEILEQHRGNSRVVFHVANPEVPDARPVVIRLKHTYVDPDPQLVARLKTILGAESVWLGGGRPVGVL